MRHFLKANNSNVIRTAISTTIVMVPPTATPGMYYLRMQILLVMKLYIATFFSGHSRTKVMDGIVTAQSPSTLNWTWHMIIDAPVVVHCSICKTMSHQLYSNIYCSMKNSGINHYQWEMWKTVKKFVSNAVSIEIKESGVIIQNVYYSV